LSWVSAFVSEGKGGCRGEVKEEIRETLEGGILPFYRKNTFGKKRKGGLAEGKEDSAYVASTKKRA